MTGYKRPGFPLWEIGSFWFFFRIVCEPRVRDPHRSRKLKPHPRWHTTHRSCAVSSPTADVIIGASDGLCLDSYRLLSAVQRTILQPESMPEVILQAQRDSFDDVTLVCRVI